MPFGASFFMSDKTFPGGEPVFFAAAAISFVVAVLGLAIGWRASFRVRSPSRRRIARSALLAFFLTPGYMGYSPAPAFVCLFTPARGAALLSMLWVGAALYAAGTIYSRWRPHQPHKDHPPRHYSWLEWK